MTAKQEQKHRKTINAITGNYANKLFFKNSNEWNIIKLSRQLNISPRPLIMERWTKLQIEEFESA